MTHVAEQKNMEKRHSYSNKPKKAPLLPDVKPDLGWQIYVFTLLHQSMFTSMACEAALYVYKKRTSFYIKFPSSVPVCRTRGHISSCKCIKELGTLDNTGKVVLLPESELYM